MYKLFIVVCLFIVSANRVVASSLIYSDEFDINNIYSNYDVYLNAGTANVNDSVLKLSSYNSNSFPNLHLNYILPSDNYAVEIKYKFDNLTTWGVGVVMGDKKLVNSSSPTNDQLIYYNWSNALGGIEYHYLNSSGVMVVGSTESGASDWHKMRYERLNVTNDYYFDENLLSSVISQRKVTNITLGNTNFESPANNWTSLMIDYVRVYDLSNISLPSFSPYYSQKDGAWGKDEYDSASAWAGKDEQDNPKVGVERWGCALTSVAMLLSKYDIKSPIGETSTPKVLNDWLKSQPDGYIGDGLINWLAVSRYSKLAESATPPQAPFALEYTREPYSIASVSAELSANKYPILPLNGHFVLTHSQDGQDWIVADPNKSASERLAQNSSIARSHVFSSSHTDLSYMMFVGAPGTKFEMNGLDVDTESLTDDIGGTSTKAVVALYHKPPKGNYELKVTGAGSWASYLYDTDGNVTKNVWQLPTSGEDIYQIAYSPVTSDDRSVAEKDLTPPPTPTLSSPVDSSYTKSSGLVMHWIEVTDPSGVGYEYRSRLGNGSYTVTPTGSASQIENSSATDGEYYWSVRACDNVSNCSAWSEDCRLIIHNTAPTSQIVLPTSGAGWDGKITGTASDSGSGIERVEIVVKTASGTTITSNAFGKESWEWTLPDSVKPDTYNVEIRAVDLAGNMQDPATTKQIVVPPIVVPPAPIAAPKLNNPLEWMGIVWLDWNRVSGAARYEVRYGTSSDRLDKKINAGKFTWYEIFGLKNETYYFGVVAIDNKGNVSPVSNIRKVVVHRWLWSWRLGWYW